MVIHLILLVVAVLGPVCLALCIPALSLWWAPLLFVGFYVGLFLLMMLAFWITSLFIRTQENTPGRRRFHRWVALIADWVMVVCGKKVVLEGADRIPTGQPFLLVSNHRSNFDPIVTMAALKKWPLSFVSKPENFRIPVVGELMKNAAFLPIDRENPRRAVEAIRQAADHITRKGLCVGIYPEGTRNKTGEGLLPFHNGSFKIAKMAKCPVVVTTVRYIKNQAILTAVAVLEEAVVAENRTDALCEMARGAIAEGLGIQA